jgi:hypothetical protein
MVEEILELVRSMTRSYWVPSVEYFRSRSSVSITSLKEMLDGISMELNNPTTQEHKEFLQRQLRLFIGNLLLHNHKSQEAEELLAIAQDLLFTKK